MTYEEIETINGVPFFLVQCEEQVEHDFALNVTEVLPDNFKRSCALLRFRAVSIDRLDEIKTNGIDVVPIDSHFYCDVLDKALEYGDWPKVIMGFDPGGLEKTYREVAADIDPAELEHLTAVYPNVIESEDRKKLWLSRLSSDDPRITTPYEWGNARWIPGSPWDCLKLVMILQ